MIKIEVSRRDVAWLLRPLQEFPKECQGAMWQAVKRSLSTARKEMTEEISALAYLKRSVIRDAVQPVQMYGKKRAEHDRRYKVADKDKVFGVIRVSGRKTPLDAYRLAPNAPTRPKGLQVMSGRVRGISSAPVIPSVTSRRRPTARKGSCCVASRGSSASCRKSLAADTSTKAARSRRSFGRMITRSNISRCSMKWSIPLEETSSGGSSPCYSTRSTFV